MNASMLLDRILDSGRAEAVALITEDGEVSYRELARMVAAVASYLRELGVEREQRVLMVLDDSPAFHAFFLGAMRIEAGYTWINSRTKVYDELPFGGWKSSGYGKEHGIEAFDFYTETKSVVVSSGT